MNREPIHPHTTSPCPSTHADLSPRIPTPVHSLSTLHPHESIIIEIHSLTHRNTSSHLSKSRPNFTRIFTHTYWPLHSRSRTPLATPIHTPVSSRRHQPKRTHSLPVQLTHSHAHLPLSSSPLITIDISLPTSPTSPPSIYPVPSRSCQLSLTPVHTLSKKHLPCCSPISIAPILLSRLVAPPN